MSARDIQSSGWCWVLFTSAHLFIVKLLPLLAAAISGAEPYSKKTQVSGIVFLHFSGFFSSSSAAIVVVVALVGFRLLLELTHYCLLPFY